MTHAIRWSAHAEAERCRSLGAELAGSPERALILSIARAFEELAAAQSDVSHAVPGPQPLVPASGDRFDRYGEGSLPLPRRR